MLGQARTVLYNLQIPLDHLISSVTNQIKSNHLNFIDEETRLKHYDYEDRKSNNSRFLFQILLLSTIQCFPPIPTLCVPALLHNVDPALLSFSPP